MGMRLISLMLAGFLVVLSVAGCGILDIIGSGDGGYTQDFYPLDLTGAYGIELSHPGVGWEQTRDSAGDMRWRQEGKDAEFRVRVTAGVQNPYQDRVDMFGGWTVVSSSDVSYDVLDSPAMLVYATKDVDGFPVGSLQLSFSRRFRGLYSPFYYIITLWNYDNQLHSDYQEIFERILETLAIYPD